MLYCAKSAIYTATFLIFQMQRVAENEFGRYTKGRPKSNSKWRIGREKAESRRCEQWNSERDEMWAVNEITKDYEAVQVLSKQFSLSIFSRTEFRHKASPMPAALKSCFSSILSHRFRFLFHDFPPVSQPLSTFIQCTPQRLNGLLLPSKPNLGFPRRDEEKIRLKWNVTEKSNGICRYYSFFIDARWFVVPRKKREAKNPRAFSPSVRFKSKWEKRNVISTAELSIYFASVVPPQGNWSTIITIVINWTNKCSKMSNAYGFSRGSVVPSQRNNFFYNKIRKESVCVYQQVAVFSPSPPSRLILVSISLHFTLLLRVGFAHPARESEMVRE